MAALRIKACSYCGGENHSSLTCFKKRIRDYKISKKMAPLRRESKASTDKRAILSNTFFANNPPDSRGGYTCYLQINRNCPKWVSKKHVTLEHVLPRSKYPEVKWNVLNIKPACSFCNQTKLSNTPYQLAYIWPQLWILLTSPEWKEWEKQITPFLKRPLPSAVQML